MDWPSLLDTLRLLNVLLWGAVIAYMAPAAFNAVFGKKVRRGDPMRLAVFATGFIIVGFSLRWLIAPEDTSTWAALYVLCAADAVWIAMLARSYGRGGNIAD